MQRASLSLRPELPSCLYIADWLPVHYMTTVWMKLKLIFKWTEYKIYIATALHKLMTVVLLQSLCDQRLTMTLAFSLPTPNVHVDNLRFYRVILLPKLQSLASKKKKYISDSSRNRNASYMFRTSVFNVCIKRIWPHFSASAKRRKKKKDVCRQWVQVPVTGLYDN